MSKNKDGLNNSLKPPKVGEIVEGQVVGIGRSSIYVDLGAFGTGIIYGREFLAMKDVLRNLKKGDKIFAKIICLDNEQGYIELSLQEANQEITWEKLKRKAENGEILKVKIIGANKGGLLSKIEGIPAFLPVSQLSPQHYPRVEGGEGTKILKKLQKLVGKELEVKIFDINPAENKLILSEKAKDCEKIKEILKEYKVGDVVEGEITGVVDFGAFIRFPTPPKHKKEIPFLEGLIHISELDWQLIEHPSKIVKVGEKVKAKITNIVEDRVFLSLKALKKDPWEGIEKKYKKGQIVKGVVSKFNPFGAFVKITPEIQGLIHISEFESPEKMEEVLKIGKEYQFEILSLDPKNHKMSLKLK